MKANYLKPRIKFPGLYGMIPDERFAKLIQKAITSVRVAKGITVNQPESAYLEVAYWALTQIEPKRPNN